MAVLTRKLELQGFNFYSQRTRVSNLMLLTPIQSKIQASKISYYAPHCANEYVKETKIFTKISWGVTNDYERSFN